MLSTVNYDAFASKFQPSYNFSTERYTAQYKVLAVQNFIRSVNLADKYIGECLYHTAYNLYTWLMFG